MVTPKPKHQYTYNGPVTQFNHIIQDQWEATTWATSPKKALSHLTYRFKKEHGLEPSAKIELPGSVTQV